MAIPSFINTICSKLSKKKNKEPSSTTIITTRSSESDIFHRMFHYYDENGDGKISPVELKDSLKTAGEELALEDAEAFIQSVDSDGDGLLGFEDFVTLVDAIEEEERGRSLREAFDVYEMKGEGCITAKSLREALRKLGMPKSMEECRVMIREFDLNGDGVICFEEFKNMML